MAFASLTPFPQTTFAAPSLTLHISGPRTIEGVENLKLVTTVINTGDETLKLLNDPNSPLSKAQTDTFNIRDPAGRKPLFTGIDIPYDSSQATSIGSEDAFTILAPGQSVNVGHDLSGYNFALLDSGFYSIEARNVFYYLEPSTLTAVSIYAYSVVHDAFISGGLAVTRNSALQKRDYVGCSATETEVLQNSAQAAQNYVAGAVTSLSGTPMPFARYDLWFGKFNPVKYATVLKHFTNMQAIGYPTLNFHCVTECTKENSLAYTINTEFGTVYICPPFFSADDITKTGTLIHESTHWKNIAGTVDHAYGKYECMALAINFPELAIFNADSYAFFAENDPPLQ